MQTFEHTCKLNGLLYTVRVHKYFCLCRLINFFTHPCFSCTDSFTSTHSALCNQLGAVFFLFPADNYRDIYCIAVIFPLAYWAHRADVVHLNITLLSTNQMGSLPFYLCYKYRFSFESENCTSFIRCHDQCFFILYYFWDFSIDIFLISF